LCCPCPTSAGCCWQGGAPAKQANHGHLENAKFPIRSGPSRPQHNHSMRRLLFSSFASVRSRFAYTMASGKYFLGGPACACVTDRNLATRTPNRHSSHRDFRALGRRQGHPLRPSLPAIPRRLYPFGIPHHQRTATRRERRRPLPFRYKGGLSGIEGAGRLRREVTLASHTFWGKSRGTRGSFLADQILTAPARNSAETFTAPPRRPFKSRPPRTRLWSSISRLRA